MRDESFISNDYTIYRLLSILVISSVDFVFDLHNKNDENANKMTEQAIKKI